MADDSWDIEVNMDFHPCDRPHGMKDYVLSDLTPEQQIKLNERKKEQIRSDQKYLANHPEIRGIIVMILRILMRKRPNHDIFETIGQHFTKSSVDIQEEIIAYLKERGEVLAASSNILQTEELATASSTKFTIEEDEEETVQEETEEKTEDLEEVPSSEELIVLKVEDLEEFVVPFSEESIEGVEAVTSAEQVCRKVLSEIIDAVIEEIEIPSLDSIASGSAFPIEYQDHAFGSADSVASYDPDDTDVSV